MVLIEKSFKELSKMTEEVADKFFFARKALLVLNSNDIIKKYDLPYQAYLIKVEKAYSLLNEKICRKLYHVDSDNNHFTDFYKLNENELCIFDEEQSEIKIYELLN